jgi:acetylornithine/N-succinyldiaminopimelate aminotransferase
MTKPTSSVKSSFSKSSPLMHNYGRADIAFSHGEGCYLFDTKGIRYLDAISGIAVNALGHAHPGFTAAIQQQVARLVHVSNLYQIPEQIKLASVLCKRSGMQQAFFCNSGAESIEAAIKLARKYGSKRGIKKPTIIVTDGAFHGRTMGALAATHSPKYQEGFTPMLEGFVRVPYNDVAAINAAIAKHAANVVAILVEPAQGEGGVRKPSATYLNELRSLCDQHDMLLMLDEVQTGNGRSGKWFAYQHNGILPDVLSTAKGLGNGFPIGACLTAGKAFDIFQPGHHGSTFGGSPLASAAGLAVYEALDKEKLVQNAAKRGKQIHQGLQKALKGCTELKEIRSLGLLIGVELHHDCGELVMAARKRGLLINVASGNVIRLAPPLVLDEAEADFIVTVVCEIVKEFRP